MSRMRDMILFTLCTAGALLLIVYVSVLLKSNLADIWHPGMTRNLIRHWIGDLIGILVLTPLFLLLLSGRLRFSPSKHGAFAHGFGILIAMLMAFWIVYADAPVQQITSLYLMFLPLIWASLRFGLRGAVVTSLVIQIGVILLSHLGSQSDATVLQFQIRLLVIGVTGLFLGAAVDELLSAEQKLRERQLELDRTLHLAASSELATAMAHELNQPLSAIGAYARSCQLLMQARLVPELAQTMAKLIEEVRRAGEVVHRLREFYRTGTSRLETVAVATLMRDAAQAVRERAARHGVYLVLDAGIDLPPLSVDPVQIGTALHNLLTNAIDAIRDAKSGNRWIKLSAAPATDNMIALLVTDSGPGLNPTEIEQLFRPFSTSKSYGLGLGLSMSRSIVLAQGGDLQFLPGPGGACFRITLPVSEGMSDD